jgi:hypothetical protein
MKNLLSPVSLQLTPYNTVVPAGGTLNFDLVRQNWETTTEVYWIKLDWNLAGSYSDMYSARKLTQAGSTIKTKNLNKKVPNWASMGIYTVRCRIGLPPDDLWYKESFDFEVIP